LNPDCKPGLEINVSRTFIYLRLDASPLEYVARAGEKGHFCAQAYCKSGYTVLW